MPCLSMRACVGATKGFEAERESLLEDVGNGREVGEVEFV